MTLLPEQEDQIRRYLLGVATPDEVEQVETDLLRGDENVERLLMIEDELITDYALGALKRRERELLEKNFFSTPERQERLMIARELVKQVSTYGKGGMSEEIGETWAGNESRGAPQMWKWVVALLRPGQIRWKVAVYATLVIGLGLGIWGLWRGYRGIEVDARLEKGMVALNLAYRERRLVKARITELQYAPFRETRGGSEADGEQAGVDLPARRRAFDLLDDAVRESSTDGATAAAHHAIGRLYLARKNFEDAIAEFEAALKTAPNNARIHSDLGAALMEKSELEASGKSGRDPRTIDRSLEHLNRAIELDGSLLEPIFNRAFLRQNLGQLFQAKEDWDNYLKKDSASPWAEEARRNLKLIEERNKRVAQRGEDLFIAFQQALQAGNEEQVYSVFSRSYFRLGNHIAARLIDETLAFAQEGRAQDALARWQVLNDLGALAERKSGDRYVADLARVYRPSSAARALALAEARNLLKDAFKTYSDSHPSQAITKYAQAQAIFRRQGNLGEALLSEYQIGLCYLQQADTRRSLESYNEAAQGSEARAYKWLQSLALNGLANAQSRLTEYSTAIAICRRAHQLASEIGDENGRLRSLSILTGLYERLGKFRESWRVAQECLELSEKIVADPSQVIVSYSISARCFYSLGLYSAALDYARETLRLAETMNSPRVMSRYLVNTGLAYARLGKYEEAIEYIKRGMRIGQSAQPEALAREMTAYTAFFLGQTYRLSGAVTEAAAMIEQAADFYREKDDPLQLQRVAKERLLGHIARGEEADASNSLRNMIALYEEMRARIPDESDRNSFFAREQSVYDIAIDFTAARPGSAREAFEYSETSRARSLLDAFHNRQQAGAIAGISEQRFSGVASPLTLSEIQSRMPERMQLLQYAALEDKLIIWLVTSRRFEQTTVQVPLTKLTGLATDYLAQISGPDGGHNQRWRQKAQELYNILLRPVAPLIEPNKQICIVPDKILNRLPYGALISSATGRYLIEDYLPIYAPSASLFVLCAEEAKRKSSLSSEHLLSVGNPSFDRRAFPDLEDLPAAARESEEIVKFYPSHQLLVGPDAKKKAVLREIERAEVIHLATHYDPNPTSPLSSRLALAAETEPGGQATRRKGALLVGEIYRLDLRHARLAVLSACQTWAEDYLNGEGAVGVSRPFLAAGVPVVVSSLWKIDSPATRNMMIEFHRIRKTQKLPSAEALRETQLGMLRGAETVYRHPYYWASFIVAGGYSSF
ncbi:MAG TPA: CHAT domain-containing protein [Blastocatellia bacterium]|jgi:CHAT domain-containing protein/tetratricopeptide (TPR) repeat protein